MVHPLFAGEEEDEALKDTEGITEIIQLDPSRMDGVFAPANGAPFLLIKSIATNTGGAAMTATATETDIELTEEAAAEPGTGAAKGEAPPTEEEAVVKDSGDGDEGDGEEDEGTEGQAGADDGGAAKAADPEPLKPTKAAIKAARGAYETARREYDAAEPTTKGALDGTDVLRARADWNKWREMGKSAGLDGTEDGRARWVARHLADEAAANALPAEVIKAEEAVYKRTFTAEQRRDAADAGHALSDGSYPIETTGDLANAAHLARSGHGNVAGAKRLIARRAKELGVSNPLSDDKEPVGANKAAEPEVAEETTAVAEAPALDPAEAVEKAAIAGLISREVADSLLAKVRNMPASTEPVAAHREPDGSYVEALERDAGLPSDTDGSSDHIPAPVAEAATIPPPNANTDIMAVGKAAPYSLLRMHDALCPAFEEADVLGAYPALKSAMDAVDSGWLRQQAMAKHAAGKAKKAARFAELAAGADQLRATDPAALADARASLRKAFTAAYPDTKVSPRDRVAPGQFHRGYIAAGHAAEHAGTAAPAPPSGHTPEPQQFERGNLTAGHQSPSPADHGPNNPHPPGSSGNDYYSASEQMMAAAAMRSIHDHIQATFAGCCPMAPDRHALPDGLGMGASNKPETKVPMSMGGIPTVGKSEETTLDPQALAGLLAALNEIAKTASPPADGDGKAFGGNQAPPFGKKKKGKSAKKEIIAALKEASEAGARAALTAMKDHGDGAAVQAIVAEQLREIGARYDSQISGLTKQVEELGSQPDPAQAPVRGQMSRPETAAPVEKRSLIDEHRAAKAAQATAEREAFEDYVRMQAASPDPKVRSRAEDLLRTIPAD